MADELSWMLVRIEHEVDGQITDICFSLKVHKHIDAPHGLILPELLFYYTSTGRVPVGVHYEIEIMTPAVWESDFAKQSYIHTYSPFGEPKRHFICYPNQIEDRAQLEEVVKIWAVGTTFTLDHGIDFKQSHLFQKGDKQGFFDAMYRSYKIRCIRID